MTLVISLFENQVGDKTEKFFVVEIAFIFGVGLGCLRPNALCPTSL